MTGARSIALGGVLAALAVVLMLLGGIVPLAVYLCPMLASLLLTALLPRLPRGLCWAWYAAVSLLAVLLCADKECAFVFVFLGYYPIVRPAFSRLPRALRAVCKLLLFNLAAAAMYGLLIFVFKLEAVVQEAKTLGLWMLAATVLLGNVAFVFFDLVLARLSARKQHRK